MNSIKEDRISKLIDRLKSLSVEKGSLQARYATNQDRDTLKKYLAVQDLLAEISKQLEELRKGN